MNRTMWGIVAGGVVSLIALMYFIGMAIDAVDEITTGYRNIKADAAEQCADVPGRDYEGCAARAIDEAMRSK